MNNSREVQVLLLCPVHPSGKGPPWCPSQPKGRSMQTLPLAAGTPAMHLKPKSQAQDPCPPQNTLRTGCLVLVQLHRPWAVVGCNPSGSSPGTTSGCITLHKHAATRLRQEVFDYGYDVHAEGGRILHAALLNPLVSSMTFFSKRKSKQHGGSTLEVASKRASQEACVAVRTVRVRVLGGCDIAILVTIIVGFYGSSVSSLRPN